MKPLPLAFDRQHVERFGDRKISVVARARRDIRCVGLDHPGEPPAWRTAPSLRGREEVPISGKSFAHRCVGDIIRRKSEEFELQPDRAVGERQGWVVDRASRAQVVPFDVKLDHPLPTTLVSCSQNPAAARQTLALARMRQQENKAAHDKGGATDDQRQA